MNNMLLGILVGIICSSIMLFIFPLGVWNLLIIILGGYLGSLEKT